MSRQQTWSYFIIGLILLLLGMVIVGQFSTPPIAGFRDSAAALAIIAGAAVAIERTLEIIWQFVDTFAGHWWPLNVVSNRVNTAVSQLSTNVHPFYQQVDGIIEKAAAEGKLAPDQVKAARQDLTNLQAGIKELAGAVPDNQQVKVISTLVNQVVTGFQDKYPAIKTDVGLAGQTVSDLADFVDAFKDNPGRRLVSVFAGSLLGLIVAGTLGVDVFGATGVTNTASQGPGLLPHLTTAVTGLVIGLGSNPTHDVIRALQEFKKSQQGSDLGK